MHPILDDIQQLRKLDKESSNSGDSYLYSITEIELYVSCIDMLKRGFEPVKDEIKSPAFRTLCDFILELASSEYYAELNKKLKALASRVHEVRSVTIGVNLDRELRPSSAGVISINSEQFKSGKMLDKILRLSFKNDSLGRLSKSPTHCRSSTPLSWSAPCWQGIMQAFFHTFGGCSATPLPPSVWRYTFSCAR